MATTGLSLVGFMDQGQAVNHLGKHCIAKDPAPAALIAEWNAAKAKRGGAIKDAGHPEILPIPAEHAAYLATLSAVPWFAQAIAQYAQQGTPVDFKLIEIDPLLAYQFHVCMDRSQHHCRPLGTPPTIEQLMQLGLPTAPPADKAQLQIHQTSALFKSKSLNFRMINAGIFPGQHGEQFSGMVFSQGLPSVHVVRFDGRCYLYNGFHRTVGARLAGATHVPCLFRDVPNAAQAGIRADGGTFSAAVLASNDPPTVGHFTQGRAHEVTLRATSRVLHVTWSEYVVFDDDPPE